MLANPANIYTNPYFLYFNLSLPFNNDIKLFKDGLILLQYMKNEEYRQVKRETKFGKLIAGTSFEDYAINNKALNNNKNFLRKKQGTAKFSFAFIFNNETFGVWVDYNQGLVFVSSDFEKNTPFLFATTLEDHSPNTLLLSSVKHYNCWKVFITAFRQGNIRFENMKIKNICNELIRHLIK